MGRLSGTALLAMAALLTAGCGEKSMEQVFEEVVARKQYERPLKVALASGPASAGVGEVALKAEITDAEGRPLGEQARVRFLYWKAYEKVPSAPEEIVREAPEVVRESDRTFGARVKFEKPGVWKVSVKVEPGKDERPHKEPTTATFTLDVRGGPNQAKEG